MEGPVRTLNSIKTIFLMVTLGSALLVYTHPATADLVRWNLENVTFNDGGVATGFFVVDTTQFGLSRADFDIKVTGGTFPSFEYTPQSVSGGGHGELENYGLIGAVGPGALFYTTTQYQRSLELITRRQSLTPPLTSLNYGGASGDFLS